VSGGFFNPRVEVSEATPLPETESISFGNLITPGWLNTFGTPLVAGRDLQDTDRKGAPPVVVVNQTFQQKILNGANPIGHTIRLFVPTATPNPSMQIVGVAANAVYRSLREPVPPTMYMPMAQHADELPFLPVLVFVTLSVRASSGSPSQLTKSVAAAIGNVNSDLALTFRPLADQVGASLAQERLLATLSGFFGTLALVLAGLGLYGVTSYAVTRRRAEIGIRMALGADPARVVRLVLSRVTLLIGIGVLVGVGVSLWVSQFVASLLYGLRRSDPVTLIGAAAALAAVGVLSGWLPAYRASRIDPAETLREN
jgi:predicted permease